MASSEIPVIIDLTKPLPSETTMIVTTNYTREYKVRKWLGIELLKMAAKVFGAGIRIEERKGE